MPRSAMRPPSANYAGDRALSLDVRGIDQGESLKVHATESLKEVTV